MITTEQSEITMIKTNFNGWTNYETWNVKLWIDNDQGTQEYWKERAQEAFKSATPGECFTREEQAALDLAHTLKQELDNDMHEMGVPELPGFYADLLNAALSEVNWQEIARSFIDDLENN